MILYFSVLYCSLNKSFFMHTILVCIYAYYNIKLFKYNRLNSFYKTYQCLILISVYINFKYFFPIKMLRINDKLYIYSSIFIYTSLQYIYYLCLKNLVIKTLDIIIILHKIHNKNNIINT